MEGITLNTLPTWAVGMIMLYTGYIWLVTRKRQIRMDSRIIAYTLILQGIGYILGGIFPREPLIDKVIALRMIIILMCLSQSVPLTISYIRGIRRDKGL